ncbi:MAG: ABC-F family ATP-binding cassette domain-containing protein, partial [Erysipelotrichaceae bacterium]|nr:ABC-F family ATP-binding cassette domain-containing protein [Erysipelotrichaceae bacterium]
MILTCSSLTKTYQATDVLKDITFQIDDHDKMAIIGVNGAGKSTLLRLITGQEEYDAGLLNVAKSAVVGYLSQEHVFDLDKSIYATLEEPFEELMKIETRMRELEQLMATSSDLDSIMKEYDALTHRFEDQGGYAMESEIKGILNGLGFDESMWSQPMAILSGGQKTRIALGQLLLQKPDLLLLDEPTNHLDIDSIEWLESYLKNYSKALIVVSHDRYFIDQVTTSIMEIENGRSKIYHCHYSEYAAIKKHDRDVELKHYINNQKDIKRMQASIDLLKSFNREKQVKRAESKEKALARMEKIERPAALPEAIRISFDPEVVSGYDVLDIKDLAMSFDQPLFDSVSFTVKREERVALLGPNGIGKTTLLHLIMNDYLPDEGVIKLGVKVMIGYYDQEQTSLTPHKTVFEEI